MRSLRILFAAACMICMSTSTLSADMGPEYLLRVESGAFGPETLVAEFDVLADLGTSVIVRGDAGDVERLSGFGLGAEILDLNPEGKEYYLVYLRDAGDERGVADLGDILSFDGTVAVVRASRDQAIRIAGFGHEIARLFMEPMKPVSVDALPDARFLSSYPEVQAMVDAVSQANLETVVDDLVAFGTRRSDTSGGEAASVYIHDLFLSYGFANVTYHDFNNDADNVVAEIPGAVFPENIIVIGGHYDSLASGSSAPGADDNASGTAGVLEVARVMSGYTFENTVRFIAFASEEFGLVGSSYYARDAEDLGENIIAMLNVDMIGYRASNDTADVDIVAGSGSSSLRNIAFWATEEYVPGFPAISGSSPSGGTSDHASFTSHGFPAIWFFEDSGRYSPYIHTSSDVVGTSLNDFELAKNCTKSMVATTATLAGPDDGLAMAHRPLGDTTDDENPYEVLATVISVEPLDDGYPLLRYAIDGGAWVETVMMPAGGPGEYAGLIPAQELRTDVEYYIEVADVLGNSELLPVAAPGAVYSFDVRRFLGWGVADMQSSTIGSETLSRSSIMGTLALVLVPMAAVLILKRRSRQGVRR